MSPMNGSVVDCDALVVGTGFSGISAIYRLRKLGLKVKAFESGTDFGGVWYWNRYPGARVDSEWPFYQLNIPEAYKDWNFSHKFPDHTELRNYVAHIDKVLGLRKDVKFGSEVNSAEWDEGTARWTVKTRNGHHATCKYLLLCTGVLHKPHSPDFEGLADYKGAVYHSASWPEDVDLTGKKIAIIGAGATSVQLVQELGKIADHLTMFMRRPSMCLPMRQRAISEIEQMGWKPFYAALFEAGRKSGGGMPASYPQTGVFEVSEEERETYFERLWVNGSTHLALLNYNDILLDLKANRVVYDFWAKKIRSRMTNEAKKDLMAPVEPPYPFITKRPPLEQNYYEMLDQDHVEIADLNAASIKSFTEKGILTEDGVGREFDAVVLATGFDSFTGSVTNMGIKNKEGVDIKDMWDDGIRTYLGIHITGFPNAFMVYSPQSPATFTIGPSMIECQCDYIIDVIAKLEKEGARSIEPLESAQQEWNDLIVSTTNMTLLPLTESWWTGSNVPGKKPQSLTFVSGLAHYDQTCRDKIEEWKGFVVGV